jgi:hypothetical protein
MKKPACVGRDGFKVTPLRFRIERPECEGRFARTGYAGKYDESIARNVERNIFEIVLPGSMDANIRTIGWRLSGLGAAHIQFIIPLAQSNARIGRPGI